MQKNGIGARPFFWPMHKQIVLKKMNLVKSKNFPNSEYISTYGLYLPSYLGLKRKDLDRIISVLNKILKH